MVLIGNTKLVSEIHVSYLPLGYGFEICTTFQDHGTNKSCYLSIPPDDCINWKSNQTQSFRLFDEASYSLSGMTNQIIIKTRRDNKEWLVLKDETINSSLIDTLEQRSRDYGKCHTIRLKNLIKDNDVKSIKFM